MRKDDEFKTLLPALTPEQYKELEASCIKDGIRDALVLWDGILLDGHNRHAIAQEHELDYKTQAVSLPDREAAKKWIIRSAIARRNLTPDRFKILSGQTIREPETGTAPAKRCAKCAP
jgi:hypothetical protein